MGSHRRGAAAVPAPGVRTALGSVALLLLALAGASCGSEAPRAEAGGEEATIVELVTLRPEAIQNVVEIPGQLEAEMTVEIRSEVEGVLESIEFQEGDFVEKGTVLFRLRDDRQRALLHEARAQLGLAEATWRRTKNLAGRDVSSAAQLERAEAELGVARARVEAAKVELERTSVRAPFDGVLGALPVAPGRRVLEETTLVRIDSLDRLQLLFYLPERAVGVVQPGLPVSIGVAPYPEERFAGEVYFVSPTLEPEGRRILIKAWVPNRERKLRPGLFAEVEAEVARRDDAILVPESALIYDLDGTYVWRVDGERRARRVPVELGLRQAGRVEIATGLEAGDEVVAAGIHKVRPGTLVSGAEAETRPPLAAETREPAPPQGGES